MMSDRNDIVVNRMTFMHQGSQGVISVTRQNDQFRRAHDIVIQS